MRDCSGLINSLFRPLKTTGEIMDGHGMKTFHVRIFGSVQGVCFRDYTRRQAETLEVTGWVRNRSDGSVEALICGEEAQLKKMVEWLHHGSPASSVQNVIVDETACPPENNAFLIKR